MTNVGNSVQFETGHPVVSVEPLVDFTAATAIAFPIDRTQAPKFGNDALASKTDEYYLLVDWKLLLALPEGKLHQERTRNSDLDRILEQRSLADVTKLYFEWLLSKVRGANSLFKDQPQCIVGIPASLDTLSEAARKRYRDYIVAAFRALGFPDPRFFPEPFAVFQNHHNQRRIVDIGRPQNVLVVDIGGGTTNICVVQTSSHGRLARGGTSHLPFGVQTIDIGGAAVDQRILQRVVKSTRVRETGWSLLAAEKAKRWLVAELTAKQAWDKPDVQQQIRAEIDIGDQGQWPVTGYDLVQILVQSFWPALKHAILECINEVAARNESAAAPLLPIDIVLLAGGGCQIPLIKILLEKETELKEALSVSKYVCEKDYQQAVANGLAIEACANSRLHKIKATRVASYIQSDIEFFASHLQLTKENTIDVKVEGPQGKFSNSNILIKAPISAADLNNKKIEAVFKLKQPPATFHYLITPSGTIEDAIPVGYPRSINLKRREGLPGTQGRVSLVFDEAGVCNADFSFYFKGDRTIQAVEAKDASNEGWILFNGCRLDFHDLHGIDGDIFVGIDFGTSTTQVSVSNLADVTERHVLPDEYKCDIATLQAVRQIEQDANAFSSRSLDRKSILSKLADRNIIDYVYHSNRIEGSKLTRGQTKSLIEGIAIEGSRALRNVDQNISEFSYVDRATGEVRVAGMPVRDGAAAVNLRDAFRNTYEAAISGEPLTKSFIKQLHQLVARGDFSAVPGEFRTEDVEISQTTFVPPSFLQVVPLLDKMLSKFETQEFKRQPVIFQAAIAHAEFVSIHPFKDYNGRVARLIVNYYLWKNSLPGILLPWENKDRYYDALEECNSTELRTRGNLTDLVRLFYDHFEDELNTLKELVATPETHDKKIETIYQAPDDANVIDATATRSPRLNKLLERLGATQLSADLEVQFSSWSKDFNALLSNLLPDAEAVSRIFEQNWAGKVAVRQFPIIDFETYRAIRTSQRYSRTWFFQTRIFLPKGADDLIFYFAAPSPVAKVTLPSTSRSVSLHISRYDETFGRHIPVHRGTWCRIKEFVHDGSRLGYLISESQDPRVVFDDDREFADWFAILIEDVLKNRGIHLGEA